MNPPQAVTERYVSNLIMNGRNKDFDVDTIIRRSNVDGGDHVGFFYTVAVVSTDNKNVAASAPTIAGAIRLALERHNVTFR